MFWKWLKSKVDEYVDGRIADHEARRSNRIVGIAISLDDTGNWRAHVEPFG